MTNSNIKIVLKLLKLKNLQPKKVEGCTCSGTGFIPLLLRTVEWAKIGRLVQQTRFDTQILILLISIPEASFRISTTKKPDTFVSGLL